MNRWPGATPLVSYGDALSISLNETTILTRQNLDLPLLVPQKLSQIFPNRRLQKAYPDIISKTLQRFNVEAIPAEIITEPLMESRTLELPDAIDLSIGNKLALQNDSVVWANNDTLTFIQESTPTAQINVRSPILEVDCLAEATILRTRVGLGVLQNSSISTILEGETMSMALKNQQVAVTRETLVNILDIATGQTTLTHRFPKCSLNGFNRISWGSSNQLFYADHDTVFLLDVRESTHQHQAAHTVRESRRRHGTAVRDIKSRGNDIFVLESTGLLWFDARQPSVPLLELQHYLQRNETSWRLDFLDDRDLLLSGPTVPFNTLIRFGTDHDFPVLRQDPYLIELWPSVCAQSQIARKTHDEKYELYISTPADGLFKQDLGYGGQSQQLPADEPLRKEPKQTLDFDFFTRPENENSIYIRNMESLMEPKMRSPPTGSSNSISIRPTYPIYRSLGFEDQGDFENYNREIWLDLLPQWHGFRQKFVDQVALDMNQQSLNLKVPEDEEEIDDFVEDVLKVWDEPAETDDDALPNLGSTLPSESDLMLGFTQPEPEARPIITSMSQPHAMSHSQPTDLISLSQPLPRRKKPKRKRVRDGFA